MKQFIRIMWVATCCMTLFPEGFGQSWGDAQVCHINARTDDARFAGRDDVIDATFKWRITMNNGANYSCTGVLMNRRVDQDQLGFYFSTARHCIHYSAVDPGAPDIDLNAEHYFMFHYESPSDGTGDTPPSNEGREAQPSEELYPPLAVRGYEYLHKSKVELVKESMMADYALLRMVTPPPPHFNLYFAGWHPSSSGIPFIGTLINPCGQWHGYVLPNHPKGDIKKINGAAALQNPTAPTYLVCNVVTTIIDVLFGWLWGNTSSTQVICSYTDFPWYTVEWCDHGVEGGSSGSPLFNATGRYVGPLSGLGNPCSGWVPTTIGKFKNVYPFAAIKNALNPSHHQGADLIGMDGRRIGCYTDLVLPGGGLAEAYYFPAFHYQSENRIQLRAQEKISVGAPITILEGAHYEFLAGEAVELNGMVDVHPGATFLAAIEGCTKSAPVGHGDGFEPTFSKLPKRLSFQAPADPSKAGEVGEPPFLQVFPNPTTGLVKIGTDVPKPWSVVLTGIAGNVVWSGSVPDGSMDLSAMPAGVYLLRLYNDRNTQRTSRVVVME